MKIDLNCDLGEGCPHDAELMPLITSANIACGFHAGGGVKLHAYLIKADAIPEPVDQGEGLTGGLEIKCHDDWIDRHMSLMGFSPSGRTRPMV